MRKIVGLLLCLWVLSSALEAGPKYQYPNATRVSKDMVSQLAMLKQAMRVTTSSPPASGGAVSESRSAPVSVNAARPDLHTRIITIRYNNPETVVAALRAQFPESRFSVDKETRVLMVTAEKKQLPDLLKLIGLLDQPLPQIGIEVRVIELNTQVQSIYQNLFSRLSDGLRLNADLNTGQVRPLANLELVLQQLTASGDAHVLARPTLSTLENHSAIIHVGDKIPYTTTLSDAKGQTTQVNFLDAGIELDILPVIVSGNVVQAHIQARMTSVKMWKQFGNDQYPLLSQRRVDTYVRIPAGETLVIAGLLNEEERLNTQKLPIVSDIPILGALFSGRQTEKSRSDIMFLITPVIRHSRDSIQASWASR